MDIEHEGFVVRFAYDVAGLASIKAIQRRRWVRDRRAWLVDRHWPSVRRLFAVAAELGWTISADARAAAEEIRAEREFLECSVDVVHDHCGASWFLCEVGDDDELKRQVSAVPGASWDDGYRIPTDWELSCGPLLEIVESNRQIYVSDAAWRLLTEADAGHLHLRSHVIAPAASNAAEQGFPEEADLEVLSDPNVPSKRRPRVTARGKLPTAELEVPLTAANEQKP